MTRTPCHSRKHPDKGVERPPTPATKVSFEMIDLDQMRVAFFVMVNGAINVASFDHIHNPSRIPRSPALHQ